MPRSGREMSLLQFAAVMGPSWAGQAGRWRVPASFALHPFQAWRSERVSLYRWSHPINSTDFLQVNDFDIGLVGMPAVSAWTLVSAKVKGQGSRSAGS